MNVADTTGQVVPVGRVSGVFGVRGWVRVHSWTSPPENIVRYSPWQLHGGREQGSGPVLYPVVDGRAHGSGVVARLDGVDDRDAAEKLIGASIEVLRTQLGSPGAEQFFWVDLVGMQVRTPQGQDLGAVDHLFETGANDVMVVVGERRHLVPFVYGSVIRSVDPEQRLIIADWDQDF